MTDTAETGAAESRAAGANDEAVTCSDLVIPSRFCGPTGSGNGGYTAGIVAAALRATGVECPHGVEVTLRRPPPLARPLAVTATPEGVTVCDGETRVAEARPAPRITADVPAVSHAAAVTAAADYPGFAEHPFPRCFTCGPQRAVGDGLRIFSGRLPEGRTAAPWRVPDDIGEPGIGEPMVWAALDCPGGWTVQLEQAPHVLGRIAANMAMLPAPGEDCVVTGQVLGTQGRKALVATALYSAAGVLLAHAIATWIGVPAGFGSQVT